MYHLKYKGFSYNPFIIIDFLILTNEAFKLPKPMRDSSNYLQELMDDGKKFNWLYSKEDPTDYMFIDFCRDNDYGMMDYLCNLDDDYPDFMNMIQIWLAFDYIHNTCHSAEELEASIGTTKMALYINQFKLMGAHKTLDWEWLNDPIEKRWWIDDDEFDRWNNK